MADLSRSEEEAAHTPVKSNLKGWLVGSGIVLLAVSIGLFGRTPAPNPAETLSAHIRVTNAITATGMYRPASYWVFGAAVICLISAAAVKNKP